VAGAANLSFLVAAKNENPRNFSAWPAGQNRQIYWHIDAQTICPRVPRKPSDQGRIAMGTPPASVLHPFLLYPNKENNFN
jgi:hypothetical protein